MLTLSSVIAAGGVLTDSTATVIGAMIIAPLSTPIMGIALGSVQRRRTASARTVLLACLLVIAVGMVMSVALPSDFDLLSNSQISSRTSPGLRSCGLGPIAAFAAMQIASRGRPRRPERVRRRRARTRPRRRPGRVGCRRSTRAAPAPVGRDAGPVCAGSGAVLLRAVA
ncbi:DUF389 domain-containing protein [Streptomyces sp. NPDC096191]|uniref:DUF389 domain-containing protein n=1 Tax=Streptomyces sp. NPDC096191 TaxID=3155426 RepID=UPI003319010C